MQALQEIILDGVQNIQEVSAIPQFSPDISWEQEIEAQKSQLHIAQEQLVAPDIQSTLIPQPVLAQQPTLAQQPSLYISEAEPMGDLSGKFDELNKKYEQLKERNRRVLEERDSITREMMLLRKKLDEYEGLQIRSRAEAIKVLNQLVEAENALYEAARASGTLPSNHDAYNRHNQFVGIFFKLMTHGEN